MLLTRRNWERKQKERNDVIFETLCQSNVQKANGYNSRTSENEMILMT